MTPSVDAHSSHILVPIRLVPVLPKGLVDIGGKEDPLSCREDQCKYIVGEGMTIDVACHPHLASLYLG